MLEKAPRDDFAIIDAYIGAGRYEDAEQRLIDCINEGCFFKFDDFKAYSKAMQDKARLVHICERNALWNLRSSDHWRQLAYCYQLVGNDDAALHCFENSCELTEDKWNSSECCRHIADICVKRGDTESTRSIFKRMLVFVGASD